MKDYSDIIHVERPVPLRPKMDLGNRAKIFSSFDALRGFDLALLTKQVERELQPRLTLMDDAQELLDRKLRMMRPGSKVIVTYFRLEKMIGSLEVGNYITETGEVEEIDQQEKTIILRTAYIPISDVVELEDDLVTDGTEVYPY